MGISHWLPEDLRTTLGNREQKCTLQYELFLKKNLAAKKETFGPLAV